MLDISSGNTSQAWPQLVLACWRSPVRSSKSHILPQNFEVLYQLHVLPWSDSLDNGIILTEQDLHILTQRLKPATPQWKAVGLALGFLDHELTTIESKPLLVPEGTTGYFRELLSQWLKWAPPNHPSPTIKSLGDALQCSGHESLEVDLMTQRKGGMNWFGKFFEQFCDYKYAFRSDSNCNTTLLITWLVTITGT